MQTDEDTLPVVLVEEECSAWGLGIASRVYRLLEHKFIV